METRQCKRCKSVLPLSEFFDYPPFICIACLRESSHKTRDCYDTPVNMTGEDWYLCKKHFDFKCAYCGAEADLDMEHFLALRHPLTPGHVAWNVVPSCAPCNSSKSNRHPEKWLPWKFGALQGAQIYTEIVTYFRGVATKKEGSRIYIYLTLNRENDFKPFYALDKCASEAHYMQSPLNRNEQRRLKRKRAS